MHHSGVTPFRCRRLTMAIQELCQGQKSAHPEGPARQIDVSRQKLSPHCLEAIFDFAITLAQIVSLNASQNCLSPTREGFLSSFKINPAVRVIARQVRDKNYLAAIFAPRHQSVSSGPLGRGFCTSGTRIEGRILAVWLYPCPRGQLLTLG